MEMNHCSNTLKHFIPEMAIQLDFFFFFFTFASIFILNVFLWDSLHLVFGASCSNTLDEDNLFKEQMPEFSKNGCIDERLAPWVNLPSFRICFP